MRRASRAKGKQVATAQLPAGYDDATSPETVQQDEVAPRHERRSSSDARVRILPVHP